MSHFYVLSELPIDIYIISPSFQFFNIVYIVFFLLIQKLSFYNLYVVKFINLFFVTSEF